MLDEVINMLAAVRDAAAADTYSALLASSDVNNLSSTDVSMPQHCPSTRHVNQHQRRQRHRRAPLRPASVASIDLRDHDEM